MFAEVIINNNAKALNKIFDYEIPEEFESKIHIGSRIFVPFGRGKKLEDGFVIAIKEKSEFANKGIAEVSEEDCLTEFKINLAKLMSKKYFCNISECIKLMLPPGTGSKELENRAKEKAGSFVYLNRTLEELEELLQSKTIKSEKHIRAINFLKNNDGIYKEDLCLLADVSASVIKTLEKNGHIKLQKCEIRRNPFINKHIDKDEAKVLNPEQQECFDGISKYIDEEEYSSNLIYGVTGSGKTEIYLRLIEKVLNKNKTAIVLVPEISLTPQMVDRFLARFGDCIAILHSKLSVRRKI